MKNKTPNPLEQEKFFKLAQNPQKYIEEKISQEKFILEQRATIASEQANKIAKQALSETKKANVLSEEANKIAHSSKCLSGWALAISILVAIFTIGKNILDFFP